MELELGKWCRKQKKRNSEFGSARPHKAWIKGVLSILHGVSSQKGSGMI